MDTTTILYLTIGAGVLAVLYGIVTRASILKASPGNQKMQEIAGAIQEGAKAYLKRQYRTIGYVGVVVFLGLLFSPLGMYPAIGFLIGAVLSGAAGYIGMLISVQANVRTTEAARTSL
ncbi:MAG: sodium/proton-translocating pyrophosphatase, partial [Sphingomonadales bacterium]